MQEEGASKGEMKEKDEREERQGNINRLQGRNEGRQDVGGGNRAEREVSRRRQSERWRKERWRNI